MENIEIRFVDKGVAYAKVVNYGANIVEDIIPEAVSYTKEYKPEKLVLEGLNGVTLELNLICQFIKL